MGGTIKGRILAAGTRDKIYDFPTDSSANFAPPLSPLLLRLKLAWIGVVVSFLLFSASSQRKTSVRSLVLVAQRLQWKNLLLPPGEGFYLGGCRAGEELKGVCQAWVWEWFSPGPVSWPRAQKWTIHPHLNCHETEMAAEVTKWPATCCPISLLLLKGGLSWKRVQFSVSSYRGGAKDAPHSGPVSCG